MWGRVRRSFRFRSETGEMEAKIVLLRNTKNFVFGFVQRKRNSQNLKRNDGKQVKWKRNGAQRTRTAKGANPSTEAAG
jgi:hypothetical protein